MLYPRGDAVQPKAIMACKFPVRARAPLAMLLCQNVVAKIDGPFVTRTDKLCRTRLRRRITSLDSSSMVIHLGPAPNRTDRVVRVVRDASVLRRALFPKKMGPPCPQLCPRRRDANKWQLYESQAKQT